MMGDSAAGAAACGAWLWLVVCGQHPVPSCVSPRSNSDPNDADSPTHSDPNHTAAQAPTGVTRTVFEATAVHDGRDGDLVEVVPYLVRAVFQDFPGANAQVRRITFELKKP